MEVFSNIVLNLQAPAFATVFSPQGQTLSRSIQASLMDGATPWEIPETALCIIRYAKPDGTKGFYDTLEDDSSAYSYNGNVVTFGLATQALTVPGTVLMQLDFYNSDGEKLSTFTFRLIVAEGVFADSDIASEDFINVLTAKLTEASQIFQEIKAGYGAPLTANTAADMTDTSRVYVYTGTTTSTLTNGHWYYWDGSAWADGGNYNSTGFTTDTTLTIAGAAADAKVTGDAVGALKSTVDQIYLCDLIIEQGGIYSSNGNNSIAENRVRTANYIYGNASIKTSSSTYVVFGIAYYNAETKAFDSYSTVNARSATIGKSGCVARVVFANVNGSIAITPQDLKRSLAIEKISADVSELQSAESELDGSAVKYSAQDKTAADQLQARTNIGALSIADIQQIIAPEFDSTEENFVGDYRMHDGKTYICTAYKSAGAAWDLNANWKLAPQDSRNILYDQVVLSDLLLEQGGINTLGAEVARSDRVRTKNAIYGDTIISITNKNYVIFAVVYFNATTGAFDEFVTVNARYAKIGKSGCFARVVFANVIGSNAITPQELKRSLAFEQAIESIGADIDGLKNAKKYEANAAGSLTIAFPLEKGKHYVFSNKSSGTCVMNLRALKTATTDYTTAPYIRSGLRQGAIYRYHAIDDYACVWMYANAAYTLEIYEDETNLGMTLTTYNHAPKTAFDSDYTMYDYSSEVNDVVFNDEENHPLLEQAYALFDAMAANHTDYITKVDASTVTGMEYPEYANGVSGSSTYLDTPAYKTYMYQLVDKSNYNDSQQDNTNIWANRNCPKQKLLLLGGVHGNEVYAVIDTYLFAKNLAENFLTNPNYFKLRTLFDVYIVPCVNGYGIYHRTRANANKVNIERNFPVSGWVIDGQDTIDRSLNNYTGPSAGSEFETQLVMKLADYLNPDMMIDHHNYGGETKLQFYVETCNGYLSKRLYKSLIDCAIAFKREYPASFGNQFSFPQSNDGSAPGTTRILNEGKSDAWFIEQGYDASAIVEMSATINYQGGVYVYPLPQASAKDVFAIGEYTFRNVLMRMAEYLMDKE